MFEFLFKYSPTVYAKGDLVLLGRWPVWLLVLLALVAATLLAWPWLGAVRRGGWGRARAAGLWLFQVALVTLLLVLLWRPAVSVATLRSQQNIVAVLVDDSRSMGLRDGRGEGGQSRLEQAKAALNDDFLRKLRERFQVRLYRVGEGAQRVENWQPLQAQQTATHLGDSLQQVANEGASLPLGAVVLVSDGSDNAGGVDIATLNAIRSRRIPVHTVGLGRERAERDVEVRGVQVSSRALPESRLAVTVTFVQNGYSNAKGRVVVRDGTKPLASRDVTFGADGKPQTETLSFNAGAAGAHALQVAVDPLPSEENAANNAVTRLVQVDDRKLRVLYFEGEPRWEYKFIRRALEDDQSVQLVSVMRTTQNKLYRQGVSGPGELEGGFPATVEELFGYDALVIGSVEAGAFTGTQLELIRQFADRRGGGVLFLAGRNGLGDGGYANSPLAELLPVSLPSRRPSFRRDPAKAELTVAGRESLVCRLEENGDRNAERWRGLPLVGDYQEVGAPKPGATVLLEAVPTSKGRLPLLVVQPYGRGRSAVLASGATWRWQMDMDVKDQSHELFWRQMVRWLGTDTPSRILATVPQPVLTDESRVRLRAEVRDKSYTPLADAAVEAKMLGPGGLSETVTLRPDPSGDGVYTAEWTATAPGAYVAEVVAKQGETEVGRDVLQFRKEVGVAEGFRTEQNRELLEQLSVSTGGRYYTPRELGKLTDDITYSEAGLSARETRDLWDMPAVFLALLGLRGGEWLLRRRWGAV